MTYVRVRAGWLVCVSDVPSLHDCGRVDQFRGEVSSALLEYCSLLRLTSSDTAAAVTEDQLRDDQLTDRFGQLLLELSEIKLLSVQLEEFLYQHYLAGTLADSSLLVEMLLSSRQ